jgi:MarR family 2-MHQ and catechol resistance regulon transcriptional repressor
MPTRYHGTETETRALNAYITLMRAAESVAARVNERCFRDGNIRPSQFGVLEALYHVGPLHQKEIGRKVLKTEANMTLALGKLERGGWVKRTRLPDDRRYWKVSLTPAGRRAVERVLTPHVAAIVEEMGLLTAPEQETLRRLCRAVGKKTRERA